LICEHRIEKDPSKLSSSVLMVPPMKLHAGFASNIRNVASRNLRAVETRVTRADGTSYIEPRQEQPL